MFLNVRELELKKLRFDVAFAPGEIDFADSRLRQIGPLTTQGQAELLSNTLGEIRVKGRLKVTMESDCDRCLEPAQFPIESDYDLFYRPTEALIADADEVQIDEGESEIAFYEGEGLDLKDVLREQILLSMPMQRICKESCLGMCPVCGQNRNQAACGCEKKKVDDRWSALKKIEIARN